MNRLICTLILTAIYGCKPPETDKKVYGDYEPLDTAAPDEDSGGSGDSGGAPSGPARLTILHTNDWQSHMLGWGPNSEYTPDIEGDDTTVGGLARTKTLVDQIRGASPDPVLLYDGGDWMAGTLFQLLATSHASELQMMELIGYDAICLGNHEFDWGPQVLGEMIAKADELGVTVPILASNTVPNPDDPGDDALEALFTSGRIQDVRVDVLDNGVSVGLFGLVGDSAARITPGVSPASFEEAEVAAAAAVEALQAMDVDIIIALSHTGVGEAGVAVGDEVLASAVPGIDVIVSGHSHTALHEPRVVGDTVIVQAGAYTRFLGELQVVQDEDGGWSVEAYTLHELTDDIPGDPLVTAAVSTFVDALEAGPLAELGYSFDEPLFEVPGDIAVEHCRESGLGDFITDAYRYTLNSYGLGDEIVAAFESPGVIRDNFVAGETGIESFSDAFRVLPLGFGGDDVPGYSLVTFYASARDLKSTCETTGSIPAIQGCDYFIEVSGLRCHLDPDRSFGNKARGVDLWQDGEWVALDITDTETLYRVAVDSYVASLMNILGSITYHAIVIEPKLADGTVVEDTDTLRFDKDPDTEGIQEVKLWEAMITYAETFPDTNDDGLPDIPASYLTGADRILGLD
jgi:5'-nucleotidase/UDP-sugar diphosphatase